MDSPINATFSKLVQKLDPKLEPYRPKKPKPAPYTPKTAEDLIKLLKRTPTTVLTPHERNIIAAAMSFKSKKVSELMLPAEEITFVSENDILGPLTLDRLYHSGFAHFPVRNSSGKITGLLHTAALNSLKIKETDSAKSYLDPKVYYLREDYSLEQALAAFLRTNCYFFLVINRNKTLVGLLTFEMLTTYLLAENPADDFDHDEDPAAVAARP